MDIQAASPHATDDKRTSYLRRFQLLRYRDVTRLRDVMETIVPIHGTGNFPTLEIRPSHLVQSVRERLESLGVKVRDIRLNGSAATHVLSDDVTHTYKDLDLIFAIDFPKMLDANNNYNNNNGFLNGTQVKSGAGRGRRTGLNQKSRPTSLPSNVRRRTPLAAGEEKGASEDQSAVDDSGYASSGSSVMSAPVSPSSSVAPSFIQGRSRRRSARARTLSSESVSSTSSAPASSSWPRGDDSSFSLPGWQEIKDATMDILQEYLPEGVNRSKMNSVVLGSAYVQKLVKITNETDEWSLISLNNNTGRNLELKFVQSMKRQFEFSVDSFQIILDTYLGFNMAAKSNVSEDESRLNMNETFHPTVIAESVYGDFAAALRHLHQRRICTHRPEEIRGGGLLRYCNLLAREFTPGDCEARGRAEGQAEPAKNCPTTDDPNDVARLEQHMCSRFFIDFNNIEQQRQKLISYLNNHFVGEDDLKFQYLLVLRQVVDSSTVCLMQHERSMILDLITMLVRETLASNVAKSSQGAVTRQQRIQRDYCSPSKPGDNMNQYPPPRYGNCLHPAMPSSERSSPISTYSSTFTPSTPGEACSAPNSPAPRPVTPAGQYYAPNQCNAVSAVHHSSQDPYYRNYPVYQHSGCCSCCCGACCCCCGYRHHYDPYPPNPGPYPVSYYPPPPQENFGPYQTQVAPIYYNPGNMTCFYQPAQYSHPPQL